MFFFGSAEHARYERNANFIIGRERDAI